jgi:hypothetical protein
MMSWKFWQRTLAQKEDHDRVQQQLDAQERRLLDHARRLRNLEIEAGIYKPPIVRRKAS